MSDSKAFIEQAYNTLKNQPEQVILLHPQSRYRSLLLAKLMNEPAQKSFYYSLDPDDISVHTLIESLTRNLSGQHALFGRYLNLLPTEVYERFTHNEEIVMQTMQQELNALSDEPFFFLLDEYDRSDESDDIHRFVELLAHYLPPQCKLVLNGRTLPRLPWIALVAQSRAAILIDDVLVERDFYGSPSAKENFELYAYTLGPGQVRVGDNLIELWEGHLPRLLLFFSLDRPVVTRSEICQAFWPDLDVDQAVNVFHVTKRRLHKALDRDVLFHNDTHYRVNPAIRLYYDAMDFVERLMEGRNPNNPNPIESWKKAADLYGGPFLQGHKDKWIIERRAAYRFGYVEALSHVADHWIGRERYEMALQQYEKALAEDYMAENIHRRLIELYAKLGRRSEAVAHYQAMEKHFNVNKRAISPETAAVYADIVS